MAARVNASWLQGGWGQVTVKKLQVDKTPLGVDAAVFTKMLTCIRQLMNMNK